MLDPSTDHAAHLPDCPRCGNEVTCPDHRGWHEDDRFYCSERCSDAAEEDRLINENNRDGLREAARIFSMKGRS